MNIPRSLTLPAVGLAIAATAFLVGRWSAPSAADGLSHFEREGSPPIPAIAASNERVDIVDKPDIEDVARDVEKVARLGYWQMNKNWEIVINSLDARDIPRLLDIMAKYPWTHARMQLNHAFYSRWSEMEPARALAHAQRQPAGRHQDQAVQSALHGWAYTDAANMRQWVRSLPEGELKTKANQALAPHLSAQDPAAAFAQAVADGAVMDHQRMLGIYTAWASTDPLKAIAAIDRQTDGQVRQSGRMQIAANWANQDPAAAWAWASAQPLSESSTLAQVILGAWAQQDPVTAAAQVSQMPAGQLRANAIKSVASNWAQKDGMAALSWLKSLPQGSSQAWLFGNIVNQIAAKDPELALHVSQDLPAGQARTNAMSKAVRIIAQTDPDRALLALAEFPEGQQKTQAMQQLLGSLAQTNPAKALQFIDQIPAGPQGNQILAQTIGQLALKDPEAAIEYVQTMPEGARQYQTLSQIASTLARQDPELASIFASALPRGQYFNNATQQIA